MKSKLWIVGGILLFLLSVWSYFVLYHPLTFWAVDEEGTIMSVAQAISLDFWFFDHQPRGLSQAQFYQPGMWFQLQSWIVYRLSAIQGTVSPLELFNSTLKDPSAFWNLNQIFPLLFAVLCALLLFLKAKMFSLVDILVVVLIYFVSRSASKYGVFMPWNESLTLILAIIFFSSSRSLLQLPTGRQRIFGLLAQGFMGGALYMHKMNYVVWALALIPALFMQTGLNRNSWKLLFMDLAIYLFSICAGVFVLGRLFLGSLGFKYMLSSHYDIFFASGLYGGGEQTVVKISNVVHNLKMFLQEDPGTIVSLILLTIVTLISFRRDNSDQSWRKKYLPELTLLMSSIFLMTLAVLKHFQLQYTVSIAALFPFWVLWLLNSDKKKIWTKFALPLIFIFIAFNLKLLVSDRAQDEIREVQIQADEADILKMPLDESSQLRLWMYRSTSPTFQRLFALAFTGYDFLLPEVVKIQGPQYLIGPWNSNLNGPKGIQEIVDVPWRYIVIPKIAAETWIVAEKHKWRDLPLVRKIELRQTLVYENLKYANE